MNNGLKLVVKGSDPADPFPYTMPYSDEMKARINTLGFQHKLWDKRGYIVVTEFEKQKNNNMWDPVDSTADEYRRIFRSDQEACIDLMFTAATPMDVPRNLVALGEPPMYCLGRCSNPLIVNTGN